MARSSLQQIKLRQTASPDANGKWEPVLNDIFNKEVYPAIRAMRVSLSASDLFPPVELTGTLNSLVPDYEHKNVLVSSSMPTQLTLSEVDSQNFQLGAVVLLGQDDAGQLELVPQGTVSIQTRQTLKLAGQYARAFLVKKGDLVWELFGDIEELPSNLATVVEDRFIGGNQSAAGNNTDANIGELAWNTAFSAVAGTVSRVASTSGRMGIVRITSANAGSHQGMYLGHTNPNGVLLDLDDMDYIEWAVRYVQGDRFRFGLGSDAGAVGLGSVAVTVNANSDVSAVWTLVLADGAAGVTVTTSVPITTSWITWKIQRIDQATYLFYADGVLIYTSSSADHPPLAGATIAPGAQVVRTTAGTTAGELDRFFLKLKTAS